MIRIDDIYKQKKLSGWLIINKCTGDTVFMSLFMCLNIYGRTVPLKTRPRFTDYVFQFADHIIKSLFNDNYRHTDKTTPKLI